MVNWEFTHEDLMEAVLIIQKHTSILPQIGFSEEGELQLILRCTNELARSPLWVELSDARLPMLLVPGDPYSTLYIGGKRHDEPITTWPSEEFCERADQLYDRRG
jgi:hypothetical protein